MYGEIWMLPQEVSLYFQALPCTEARARYSTDSSCNVRVDNQAESGKDWGRLGREVRKKCPRN